MRFAIIGAGNMGGAVARGLAQGTQVRTEDICVANPSTGKLEALVKEFPAMRITTDNRTAVKEADVVLLAVKPWKVQGVIDEIKEGLDYRKQVVASMVGGLDTATLSGWLVRRADEELPPVYCIIPNTAIAVRSSMTFLTSVRATPEMDDRMLAVFREMGDALLVEERLLNAGMVLASCGIAYAMRYLRAATEGGVELGMYARDAQRIVMQTMKGAVDLLQATGNHPEAEIDKVTTPGGLTIRGLNAMEEHGFTTAVIFGLKASLPVKK